MHLVALEPRLLVAWHCLNLPHRCDPIAHYQCLTLTFNGLRRSLQESFLIPFHWRGVRCGGKLCAIARQGCLTKRFESNKMDYFYIIQPYSALFSPSVYNFRHRKILIYSRLMPSIDLHWSVLCFRFLQISFRIPSDLLQGSFWFLQILSGFTRDHCRRTLYRALFMTVLSPAH